jgi:hypothetical protein
MPDTIQRPFAHLASLPPDVADAFEAFKLSILRHKFSGWVEISPGDTVAALSALIGLAERMQDDEFSVLSNLSALPKDQLWFFGDPKLARAARSLESRKLAKSSAAVRDRDRVRLWRITVAGRAALKTELRNRGIG